MYKTKCVIYQSLYCTKQAQTYYPRQ